MSILYTILLYKKNNPKIQHGIQLSAQALCLIHDKYKSEAVILTTTLCSLHAACTSEKAQ